MPRARPQRPPVPRRAARKPTSAPRDRRLASEPLLIASFLGEGGVAIDKVAANFGMSKSQLAETIGLGREALYKSARLQAAKTQSRFRDMLEIISRIADWAGGKDQTMAWCRAQLIAAFGGRTAESLVKSGQAGVSRDHLDHLTLGGFA
jgi:hypothetical protein